MPNLIALKGEKSYAKKRIKMRTFLVVCAVTLILLGAGVTYIMPKAWAGGTNEAAINDTDINSSAEGDPTSGTANIAAANDPETRIPCTPVEIATYQNRVHVQCAAANGDIRFFAAPTSDPQYAARVLSVISAAQVAGRTLSILYDPSDLSGASYGCQINDCRPIIAVGFGR